MLDEAMIPAMRNAGLEKIKAILESNLDDPEELLYLSFSFRLLEQEKNKKG